MAEPPPASGARVLMVDDERDQVEMYAYALEDNGFSVVKAYGGAEAIALARALIPEVIVLDVRLPDMTGWEVCRVLKNDPYTAPIPILILTALASPSVGPQATELGCAAHLLKPCYPHELADAIRTILASA